MFYGVSKNKNGKPISDFEKYTPWNSEEFSGKIEYELDDKSLYEVYREFKKKSPVVYDEKKEDITKEFSVDKSKENQFFVEQTGIIEENFFATSAVSQEETKLDKNLKNSIIQKLSNMVSTGNENISYKKTIDKLNKKQLEEIGNDRSSGRPINIIDSQIKKLEAEKEKLSIYEEQKYNINQNKDIIEGDLNEDINILNLLRAQKEELEKTEIKKAKIKYLETEIQDINNKIKDNEKAKGKHSKRNINIILPVLLAIIIIIATIITKKALILLLEIIPVIYVFLSILNLKKKDQLKQVKILHDSLQTKEKELEKEREKVQEYISKREEKIYNEFSSNIDQETIKEILSLKYEKIVEYISEKEREIANYKIGKKEVEIENEALEENLERLIEVEEKLTSLKKQRLELANLNKIYEIVKEEIEHSYEDIKDNITPDFIEELKNILKKVTNNKYNNIYLEHNNNNQIMIETENGKYVEVEKLSTGTIDLIYLALRISASNEITKEKMPILLDESFAYYDEPRLKEILKYLNDNYDNQIFILTCSNREKDALNELNIEYNQILL